MKAIVLCALALLVVHSNASAATPKSHMLVPSRTTVSKLEKLSHQSGTTVDVYTVSREERRLLLDGVGGNALTGHNIDAAAGSGGFEQVARIPFDDLALVYYSVGSWPNPTDIWFPSPNLPRPGTAEQGLSCDELDTEIGRAGAIRWNGRRRGAMPLTAHEAHVQHGKNFLGALAGVVLVAGAVVGGADPTALPDMGGSGPSPKRHECICEDPRWTVTAADQRILGLLELKRDRSCAPRDTRVVGVNDLMVLEKVDKSRQALAAIQITDLEQIHQQTSLLDHFDPPLPEPELVDSDRALLVYAEADWYPNGDVTTQRKYMSRLVNGYIRSGEIRLTPEDIVFRPAAGMAEPLDNAGNAIRDRLRVPYADLADIVVLKDGSWRAVVVTHKDGDKDTFTIRNPEDTQDAGEFLKSKLSAVPP